MDFIAIDFETANQKHDSPCSLGISLVISGSITKTYSYLINPEVEFSPINISIHRITSTDVINSPTFPEVWSEVEELFLNYPVVAHNVSFDRSVLEKVCNRYNIQLPELNYFCTLELFQYNFPDLDCYTLDSLCKHFQIELEQHHDCCCDCIACAKLMNLLMSYENIEIMANIKGSSHYKSKPSKSKREWNNFGVEPEYKPSNVEFSEIQLISFDSKNFVVTGEFEGYTRKEIMKIIETNGGVFKKNITKSTDYLIAGMQDINVLAHPDEVKSTKIIEAENLQQNGYKIEIISLQTLLENAK